MAEIGADCPRCGYDKVTFDIVGSTIIGVQFEWQKVFELFGVCRHCRLGTILQATDIDPERAENTSRMDLANIRGNLNGWINVYGYVSEKDIEAEPSPEHLPNKIEQYFNEGAKCMAVGCFNAGGTMFRLCLDTATKEILDSISANAEIPKKIRYSLGFRLEWLLQNGYLDKGLEELAECVKEDGNDGAHDGSLTEADAEDLHDFTVALLERLYSEPAKLAAAKERRAARRQAPTV